jgi:P-aminobenzoate N-oxygenase AurF
MKTELELLVEKQTLLYEHAHREPIELKPYGLALKRDGIDLTRLYCNPRYLPLPFHHEAFASFNRAQLSALTAAFFARVYAEIAGSELLAIKYNNLVAEGVFKRYSDDYMVLFNETAEECDHVVTFRAINQAVIGDPTVIDSLRYPHLAGALSYLDLMRKKLSGEAFGAVFLLLRYVLNLALKQLEGFMQLGLHDADTAPLAKEIVTHHSSDEARHLTTSVGIGMALYRASDPASRKIVAASVKQAMSSMIFARFGDTRSMLHAQLAHDALAVAVRHPAFAELDGATLCTVAKEYANDVPLSTEYASSQRWLARQVQRLAADLEVKPVVPEVVMDNFQRLAG